MKKTSFELRAVIAGSYHGDDASEQPSRHSGRLWIKLAAIAIAVLFFWLRYGLASALMWAIFLSFWLLKLDSRIVAAIALFFLASCPLYLALGKEYRAEKMAEYAYFFLAMTVALQLLEEMRESRQQEQQEALLMMMLYKLQQ